MIVLSEDINYPIGYIMPFTAYTQEEVDELESKIEALTLEIEKLRSNIQSIAKPSLHISLSYQAKQEIKNEILSPEKLNELWESYSSFYKQKLLKDKTKKFEGKVREQLIHEWRKEHGDKLKADLETRFRREAEDKREEYKSEVRRAIFPVVLKQITQECREKLDREWPDMGKKLIEEYKIQLRQQVEDEIRGQHVDIILRKAFSDAGELGIDNGKLKVRLNVNEYGDIEVNSV